MRLKDEHTLDKMNNHVATWWYSNKDSINHREIIAIKQAFVDTLSQNGVQGGRARPRP